MYNIGFELALKTILVMANFAPINKMKVKLGLAKNLNKSAYQISTLFLYSIFYVFTGNIVY